MNIERLKEMIVLLEGIAAKTAVLQESGGVEAVPPTTFDMEVFVEREVGGGCGTAACAFGHAAFHPPFAAQGLKLSQLRACGGFSSRLLIPTFEGKEGFAAAEVFFGISERNAEYLFDPSRYESEPDEDEESYPVITPEDVIERIRELIADEVTA
jgi:hypothetical protein